MATRATYLLPADYWNDQMICFYIHWEGYPEGAANYLWRMHKVKNKKGGYAGRFIRANEGAEFTPSHDVHGDTEYRYTLDRNNELTVHYRSLISNVWEIIFEGKWYVFINQYLEEKEKLYFFRFSEISTNGDLMTIDEAQAYVNLSLERALECALSTNSQLEEQKARFIQKQIDAIPGSQIIKLEKQQKSCRNEHLRKGGLYLPS